MIKIGIICPSEIAYRRFLPALEKNKMFRYVGVAIANDREWFGENYLAVDKAKRETILRQEENKAQNFKREFGGKIFMSYEDLITSDEVDAIYIPLPPALHYKWAKRTLENGKHVFVEKPSTTSLEDTNALIMLAKKYQLALHENYMFIFHEQLKEIQEIVNSGKIGEVRLYRIDFGFPRRAKNDFRYCKELGGGALLDCGGYTLKYAAALLGESAKVEYAKLNYSDEFEVDLYGSAVLSNNNGQIVQVAFGMDNAYKCDLEVWGSKGRLITGRVLTAPAGFVPACTLVTGNEKETLQLSSDDTFSKSLQYFLECIESEATRTGAYETVQKQAELVAGFIKRVRR